MIILFTNTIAPGATIPIDANGKTYELILATGRIAIRNSGKKFSGQFNELPVGIQPQVPEFGRLELKNLETFAVVFQLLVSDEDFRNNQIILASATQPLVAYPTYPTSLVSAKVNITDLTGQKFTDINGNKWLALSRAYFLVTNLDNTSPLNIQQAASLVQNGPSIDCVQPLQTHRIDGSGNFCLNLGGTMINAFVVEFYNSIATV